MEITDLHLAIEEIEHAVERALDIEASTDRYENLLDITERGMSKQGRSQGNKRRILTLDLAEGVNNLLSLLVALTSVPKSNQRLIKAFELTTYYIMVLDEILQRFGAESGQFLVSHLIDRLYSLSALWIML